VNWASLGDVRMTDRTLIALRAMFGFLLMLSLLDLVDSRPSLAAERNVALPPVGEFLESDRWNAKDPETGHIIQMEKKNGQWRLAASPIQSDAPEARIFSQSNGNLEFVDEKGRPAISEDSFAADVDGQLYHRMCGTWQIVPVGTILAMPNGTSEKIEHRMIPTEALGLTIKVVMLRVLSDHPQAEVEQTVQVDPRIVGTWELMTPGRWVWTIKCNGTYQFHSEAMDGAPSHTGTLSIYDGRWSLNATSGYTPWTDGGTYTFQPPDTLIATGRLGTGIWRRTTSETGD
jgi:hypothetical protein